jgi:hypothetical protein
MKDWKQIEKDFIDWDVENNYSSSQRQILDWFKEQFKQEPAKGAEDWLKGKGYNNDMIFTGFEMVANLMEQYRAEGRREVILKFLDFAEPIYWGENEYTDYRKILELYLASK